MPAAEIITIGTELLLGEIQDTNTRYLARNLRDAGIDLYRTMMVGDNTQRIAAAIREAWTRSDIIITTGGLGPTVDDPTRQAVALAVENELVYSPELWEQITARFQHYGRQATENNRRQAYIPKGAIPVENPVGTAPAFIIERGSQVIISLPGVPREMEYLLQNAVLPYLKEHYHLHSLIKALVLHTATMGESQIDELVGDLEEAANPTVGLLAHPGQVDLRITAKADTEEEADQMIQAMAETIRQRVGDIIYGQDEDTLESIAIQGLASRGWDLGVIEAGLNGLLINRLKGISSQPVKTTSITQPVAANELKELAGHFSLEREGLVVGVSLVPGKEKQDVYIAISKAGEIEELHRSYGGPPDHAPIWAVNLCLDLIRKNTLDGTIK